MCYPCLRSICYQCIRFVPVESVSQREKSSTLGKTGRPEPHTLLSHRCLNGGSKLLSKRPRTTQELNLDVIAVAERRVVPFRDHNARLNATSLDGVHEVAFIRVARDVNRLGLLELCHELLSKGAYLSVNDTQRRGEPATEGHA